MSTPKLIHTLKQYRHDGNRWHHIFPQTEKKKGICKVIYCKRPARVRIHPNLRTQICRTCITCQTRLYRANHVARDVYHQVKARAKERHQIFDLTFDQFMDAIRGTEYLTRRGTGIGELHLDRVKVHLGYVPGNLQVITTAENLKKQREVDYCTGPF